MTAENLTQKILEKIKEDKIEPKPKWQFLIKDYSIWMFFGLSVFIGSLSFAVMIFIFFNDTTFELLKDDWLKNSLQILPYFWLILLAAFIFIAYLNLKHTKTGYRINPYLLIGLSIVASLFIGSLIYAFGGAEIVEDLTYNKVPFYKKIANQQAKIWVEPKRGRLGGIIIEMPINNKFELRDFQGQRWIIIFEETSFNGSPKFPNPCQDKNCPPPPKSLHLGQRIGIIGEQLSAEEFFAIKIRPLIKPRPQPADMMKENN